MIIAHDPGHGIAPNLEGVPVGPKYNNAQPVERDIVMGIANDVVKGLAGWCTHVMLRTDAIGEPYTERAKQAKIEKAQLVICYHIDSSTKPHDHGLHALYLPGDKLGWEAACAIQRCAPMALLQSRLTPWPALFEKWPRVKWVLGHYAEVGIPAVLVELGYATADPETFRDAEVLLDYRSRPAIVACIAAGIARAMELTHDP